MQYHRVILKLSGEALGKDGKLFDHEKIKTLAATLKQVSDTGVQLGIVIGGGNLWRGRSAAPELHTYAADAIGMLGTVMNCLYVKDMLLAAGARAYCMSAVEMPRVCETYSPQLAEDRLSRGEIVLFAGGSGNPCFSTDTPVVLRAIELGCDAVLMGKSIDGVYTADPNKDATATLIKDITYDECVRRDLRVCDPSAFSLLKDYRVPMLRVFALDDPQNIVRVLAGDDMGTFVHP